MSSVGFEMDPQIPGEPRASIASPKPMASITATAIPETFAQRRKSYYHNSSTGSTTRPVGHVALHSIGLKPLTSKKRYTSTHGDELPKPVVVKSKLLAAASLLTHLLPTSITVFLITFNSFVFVNGPPISTLANYSLQGAAKLHELTIVSSLAKVTFDLLRHNLIYDGIGFGMLGSPFSFAGLNYLWSQEFFCAVVDAWKTRSRRHTFFLFVLIIFCFIAAAAGPASALLCIPSPSWLAAGATNTYLIGDEDQLWPQRLTKSHVGPQRCQDGNTDDFFCSQGGWSTINSLVAAEGVDRKAVNIVDNGVARSMWLWRPSNGGPQGTGTDSWALIPHAASAYLASGMDDDHGRAWNYATGRQRRLRDGAPSGSYGQIIGRMPKVRVVCAPIKVVSSTSPTILFPVLSDTHHWRNDDTPGVSKGLQMSGTYDAIVNTTWMSLPGEFGVSTAGLAIITTIISGNTSRSTGCGCSFDARWVTGYAARNGGNRFWEPLMGDAQLPQGLAYVDPQRETFFDERYTKFLSAPITADMDWIGQLSAGRPARNGTEDYSSMEAILRSTRLFSRTATLTDGRDAIQRLEAPLSAYFVSALSRVGWAAQLDTQLKVFNRELRIGDRETDALLHEGGELYQKPANMPSQSVKQEWYVYATAWQLNDPALYISVIILCTHLLVVVIDCIIVMKGRHSSEAWNSVSELIALAYLSSPDRSILQNCGAGIMLQNTLRQRVKVAVLDDEDGEGPPKVALVPCGAERYTESEGLLSRKHVQVGSVYS